jgi:hypothetical protein
LAFLGSKKERVRLIIRRGGIRPEGSGIMTENFDNQIKALLDESGDQPGAGGRAPRLLRARLSADLAEGLAVGAAAAGEGGWRSDEVAAKAAFLDGGLAGPEGDEFAATLAKDENLRADLESAAALLDSPPAQVPGHLLQQALAQFASGPAPARALQARPERLSWLRPSGQWPRARRAWAAAAVAAVLILVPAVLLLTGDRLGWWPGSREEPLSASEAPDIEPPKACDDAAGRSAAATQPGDKPEAAPERTNAAPPETAPDVPCPPKAPEQNDSADQDSPGALPLRPDAPARAAPATPPRP